MIQQSVNVQAPPPRLHPKKRKFDLSELEDDHHQSTGPLALAPPPTTSYSSSSNVTANAVHSVPSPVIISSNPTTSSTVVYQKFPSEFANNQNGNQHFLTTSGGSNNYNPHVVTQVVKNTAEVQQIIKRQSYSYRSVYIQSNLFLYITC